MDGDVCSSCGARNPYTAAHCWQCFRNLKSPAGPVASRIRGLSPASVYATYSAGFADAPTQVHEPVLPPGLIQRVALGLTIALAAWWAYGNFGATTISFPEQINGAERVESKALEAGEQMAQSLIDMTGLDVQVDYAFYGSELVPEYVMFSATVDEHMMEILAEGDDLDMNELSNLSTKCGGEPGTSFCAWMQEETIVGIGTWSFRPRVLRPTAERLRIALD